MKIKTPTEFIAFNDGRLTIYDGDNVRYKDIGYSLGVMGVKRYFTARLAQTRIDKVVKIPYLQGISQYDEVIIPTEGKYGIELIQPNTETNPPSITLTLKFLEVQQ